MSDQSLDNLLLQEYEQLKVSPHFRVTETQDDEGIWYVHIHESLGTASPFPGIAEANKTLLVAQLAAMQRFKLWQEASRKSHAELANMPMLPTYVIEVFYKNGIIKQFAVSTKDDAEHVMSLLSMQSMANHPFGHVHFGPNGVNTVMLCFEDVYQILARFIE